MKNKKGTTLVEAIISIVVVSVVIVTLLEALSVGVFGTLDVNRQTSALNLAKSQLEHINAQTYNTSIGTGNLSNVYGLITVAGSDIKDKLNYNISGRVEYVNSSTSLQKISVNVSYLHGKEVWLVGYKDAGGDITVNASYKGLLVTDNIQNMPILYSGSGGIFVGCATLFPGYYHVFNTSGGPASITWNFSWTRWDSGVTSMGAPMIAIYQGVPAWADRDYLGVVKPDGVIYRPQGNFAPGSIGDLPGNGPGGLADIALVCRCWQWDAWPPSPCAQNCANENDPVWWIPHHCTIGLYDGLPCSGACGDILDIGEDLYWHYDGGDLGLWPGYPLADGNTLDRTFTTGTLAAGTYTILFFNSEDKINIDTTAASITYKK